MLVTLLVFQFFSEVKSLIELSEPRLPNISHMLVMLLTSKLEPSNLLKGEAALSIENACDQSVPIAFTFWLFVLLKAIVCSRPIERSKFTVSLVIPTCKPLVLLPAFSKSASFGTMI